MKKVLAMLLMTVFSFSLFAQVPAPNAEIKDIIELLKKEVYDDEDEEMCVTDVYYIDKPFAAIVGVMKVNEVGDDAMPVADMRKVGNLFHDAMLSQMLTDDEDDTVEVRNLMKKYNISFVFRMVGRQSGDIFDIRITPDEVK